MNKKLRIADEQLSQSLEDGLTRSDAVALQAGLRQQRLLRVKGRSLSRLLKRGGSQAENSERRETWRKRKAAYAKALDGAEHAVRLAEQRPHPLLALAGRSGAYGQIVDEYGKPWAELALSLATPEGKALAKGQTTEHGYFSLWSPADHSGNVELLVKGADRPISLRSHGKAGPSTSVKLVVPRGQKPPPKHPTPKEPPPKEPPPPKTTPQAPSPTAPQAPPKGSSAPKSTQGKGPVSSSKPPTSGAGKKKK